MWQYNVFYPIAKIKNYAITFFPIRPSELNLFQKNWGKINKLVSLRKIS